MTWIVATLEQAITETPLAEIPALIGVLATLQAKAQMKMLTGHAPVKPEPEELLTIPEVAQHLKVSTYRAYELARQGILKSVRLGKSVRVKSSAMAEYVATHVV